MEHKAPDHFHPEWKLWLDSLGDKEAAMRVDARMGTHPIVTPIRDVLQADQAFDTITYEKGESVIRMLEQYVGADAFRDGVRSYMKAHAYGNTVTDNLWSELDKGTKLPVTQVAHDFTLQAGIPLIRVTSGAAGVHLAQERFAVDDSGKAGGNWHVPVSVATVGGTPLWASCPPTNRWMCRCRRTAQPWSTPVRLATSAPSTTRPACRRWRRISRCSSPPTSSAC